MKTVSDKKRRFQIEKLEERIAPGAIQSCFIDDAGVVWHQVETPNGKIHLNAMPDETVCPPGLAGGEV